MVQYQIQLKPVEKDTNICITKDTKDTTDTAVCICKNPTNLTGNWKRIEQKLITDVWTVYAVVDSVKAATAIAKPLMQEYGVDNVQICKVVPASTEIVFGES